MLLFTAVAAALLVVVGRGALRGRANRHADLGAMSSRWLTERHQHAS